jgi:hypothetical protein
MSPKKFDFASAIVDVARRKRDAAKARSAGHDASSETPRDVYVSACAAIAAAFEPDGFKFVKSRQRIVKTAGEFRYSILFQSSRHNVANQHIAMWIHAGVASSHLERWMTNSRWPFRPFDGIAGAQIGNLRKPTSWWEWELALPEERHVKSQTRSPRFVRVSFHCSIGSSILKLW